MDALALELDSRRSIYDAVCKYPGTHLREIGRTVNLSPNLVDYHLLYLEKRELVYSLQDGLYKRYFPKDSFGEGKRRDLVSAPDKRIVSLLRRQMPFRITLLLLKNGPMAHGRIAEDVRKSPSTVSHHLGKLMKTGVVSKNEGKPEFAISNPAKIEKILLQFNPRPATLTEGFLEIWDDLVL